MPHLPHHPGGSTVLFHRVMEISARVRHATEHLPIRVLGSQSGIDNVAIGLEQALEPLEHRLGAFAASIGLPVEKHFGPGPAVGPQVAQMTLAGQVGVQIPNRCLIGLQITCGQQPFPDLFIDRLEPEGDFFNPLPKSLAA